MSQPTLRLVTLRNLISAAILLAALLLSPGLGREASAAVHVTLAVDELLDELNTDGDCSLREAVRAANTDSAVDACPAGSGKDTISLPPGTFLLSLAGIDNTAMSGDLDILDNVLIKGSGTDQTFLDGGQIDRVIHIAGVVNVEIQYLTITNGKVLGGGLLGGGGVLNERGALTLDHTILSGNSTDQVGGGLDNAASATLVDVTVSGNSANAGGGIFNGGTLVIKNSTIHSNSATHTGGALDNALNATLENVTISGNTTPSTGDASGGGIFSDGPLFLLHATIANNSTGLDNRDVIRFLNSMVVNSTNGANCSGTGTFISEGYNLESSDTCNFHSGGDLANINPQLGLLSDNGGTTLTHALLENSPAIDAGDNISCTSFDQRGAYRPADGNLDSQKVCDIGSVEFSGAFPEHVFLPVLKR